MGSEDLFLSQTAHQEVAQLFTIMVMWGVQVQIKKNRTHNEAKHPLTALDTKNEK